MFYHLVKLGGYFRHVMRSSFISHHNNNCRDYLGEVWMNWQKSVLKQTSHLSFDGYALNDDERERKLKPNQKQLITRVYEAPSDVSQAVVELNQEPHVRNFTEHF
jgi:hypothetical protein